MRAASRWWIAILGGGWLALAAPKAAPPPLSEPLLTVPSAPPGEACQYLDSGLVAGVSDDGQLDAQTDAEPDPELLDLLPCDQGEVAVPEVVRQTARELSSQHIGYRSEPLSDCSGMFHRVLKALERRCQDIEAPAPTEARSARDLARWYEEQGRLVRLASTEEMERWLVPGAAVFFARSRTSDLGSINHVGVVIDTVRDEQGRLRSYRMFHGRQPGRPAGITQHHGREHNPPFGNGPDRLVAVSWPGPGDLGDAVADAWDEEGK